MPVEPWNKLPPRMNFSLRHGHVRIRRSSNTYEHLPHCIYTVYFARCVNLSRPVYKMRASRHSFGVTPCFLGCWSHLCCMFFLSPLGSSAHRRRWFGDVDDINLWRKPHGGFQGVDVKLSTSCKITRERRIKVIK